MAETNSGILTYDEFKKVVADVLLIDEEKLTAEASLITDIRVDSIRWAEMVLRIERLGVEIPSEAFWEIETVGDAYDCYVDHSGSDPHDK